MKSRAWPLASFFLSIKAGPTRSVLRVGPSQLPSLTYIIMNKVILALISSCHLAFLWWLFHLPERETYNARLLASSLRHSIDWSETRRVPCSSFLWWSHPSEWEVSIYWSGQSEKLFSYQTLGWSSLKWFGRSRREIRCLWKRLILLHFLNTAAFTPHTTWDLSLF